MFAGPREESVHLTGSVWTSIVMEISQNIEFENFEILLHVYACYSVFTKGIGSQNVHKMLLSHCKTNALKKKRVVALIWKIIFS